MNLKQFGYTVALVVIALSMVSGRSLTERKLRQRQSMQEIDQLRRVDVEQTKKIAQLEAQVDSGMGLK